MQLLAKVKSIEAKMDRQKTIDKGPRNIDLDILLHGDQSWDSPELSVPHKAMLEREFVLRPLCEYVTPRAAVLSVLMVTSLVPYACHPQRPSKPYEEHLKALPKASAPLTTLVPLASHLPPLTPLLATRRTQLMSILNLTPDSFSDGGQHAPGTTPAATVAELARVHHAAGAAIVDIGGQSTRPHAAAVPPDVEAARILPAVRALAAPRPAVSVDTFDAAVARAALDAGADLVNDVSAGTLDPALLPLVAARGCSVVLTHMRGTPQTMTRLTDYSQPLGAGARSGDAEPASNDGAPSEDGGDLVRTVAAELRARVDAAEAAGVPRWRIVLDPGLGFAKTARQSIELLRRLGELREAPGLRGLPWLVGASRKGFVGRATGMKEPRERGWGTAAAVAAAVQGGADVVRVHDVREMKAVVDMADAIWRA